MYSESDIDNAVTAGVIPAPVAAAFRNHVAAGRDTPAVDEEHFRLLTGFNDIFVSIAIALLLVAMMQIGTSLTSALGGVLVAGTSWALAEYFTARRRMALPSILLLLTFVGGIAAALGGLTETIAPDLTYRTGAIVVAGIALICTGAAYAHWRRFRVPITVAAGAAALAATVVGMVVAAFPTLRESVYAVVLVCGLATFALAMRWDLSDPERRTRRADVAFWLHLAAAPMIAHPIFRLLGVFQHDIGIGIALIVLALYLGFAFVALAIDRRALLVSGLAYVLYAMYALIKTTGSVETSAAITGLLIGSALLVLSAFWQPMRRRVVALLGARGHGLPPVLLAAA